MEFSGSSLVVAGFLRREKQPLSRNAGRKSARNMPKLSSIMVASICTLSAAGAARAEFDTPALSIDPAVATLDAAATQPKEWVDQVKNPTPWLSWGADERMRIEGFDNAITLNQQAPGHEWDFLRYRTRVWASVKPIEEVSLNARMIWEGRYWFEPQQTDEHNDPRFYKKACDTAQIVIDNLNAKLTIAPISTTFTVGRQDIVLGDGWLVLEGTPLDGSTTIFFDAFRSTTQFKDANLTMDLIYINQYASPDMWLPTINDTDRLAIENNERGAIAWFAWKPTKAFELDPYFIYKHDEASLKAVSGQDNADIYTFGARAVNNFTDNLMGRVEVAGQFGDKNSKSLQAAGLLSRLAYNFNDAWRNELRLNAEYLSGSSDRDKYFDPLWGRWPQFSELFVYTDAKETRIANTSNLIRFGPGYVVRPYSAKDSSLEFEFDYNALFADGNPINAAPGFVGDGCFRGHLFSAIMRYKINRYMSGHLWSEYFVPGNFYSDANRDNAVFLRAELVLTF
jgi:hypothetical protein